MQCSKGVCANSWSLFFVLLQVREGLTAWLSWLHTHLGFEGWRFDHAIGYSSR